MPEKFILEYVKASSFEGASHWFSLSFSFVETATVAEVETFLFQHMETLLTEHPNIIAFRLYRKRQFFHVDYCTGQAPSFLALYGLEGMRALLQDVFFPILWSSSNA